ncbi:SusD/RagB family nutrient-binding outer membrane lipoprotein [Chitinophaga horti]|uniref:SusD/RagB family nutrient-binding outer membrane lipoprotein n=1 Tax=Chitinophaga horti TaxID=2920382 RepID=A0ABY6J0V2_9BACT|nr:SusD/RagB family nutrient-binding outer membrane lipoprotein [Chitinophaga horti]UYQ91854.1 SusD/RagB family nutrient-binding outer membrane lipoprotein [Chitinophaga horti]
MKSIKNLAIVVIGASLFASCGKGFLDINENPNKPATSSAELVLPTALAASSRVTAVTFNQLGSIWAGHWGPATDFLWFVNEKQYNITSSFYTTVWSDSYNILNDYKFVEKDAKAKGLDYYEGISKIMQGYHFQALVDLYNNVPFSQALKGTEVVRPVYDDAQAVYEGALNLIDSGITLIKNAPAESVAPGADDIVFQGTMTDWIKFGNTLKLRMLLRQSEMGAERVNGYIKTEIAKIVAEGTGFLGVDDGAYANPGYTAATNKQNPFWDAFYKDAAGNEKSDYQALRPTQYIVNRYKNTNDPRLLRMYDVVNGGYKGVILGQNTGDAQSKLFIADSTSQFSAAGVLKAASQSVVLLSSFEALFLQAEAVQRGWIAGNVQELYEDAITESFIFLGVPNAATAAATYYGQAINNVNFTASTDKLAAIINQKWTALNSISGIEAWNDYRRLGLPADNPMSLAATEKKFPSRLLYPNSELGTNGDQVKAQNITSAFDQKVFWDK